MAKKKVKTTDQIRLETRFAIFIVYLIYNMVVVYASERSTFVANNLSDMLWLNFFLSSIVMIWSLDLKNIRGWWNKRVFIFKQKRAHRKEIEARLAHEKGLGYDKIERG